MSENQDRQIYSLEDFKVVNKIAKQYGFRNAYEYVDARLILAPNPDQINTDYGYNDEYFALKTKTAVDRLKVAVAITLLAGMGVNNPLEKRPVEFKAYISTNSPARKRLTLVEKLDEA
jgi:hypothetical protein